MDVIKGRRENKIQNISKEKEKMNIVQKRGEEWTQAGTRELYRWENVLYEREEEGPEEFGAIPQCTHVSVVGVPGGQLLRQTHLFYFIYLLKMLFRSRDWWIRRAHLAVWSIDVRQEETKEKKLIILKLLLESVWLFACQIPKSSLTDAPKTREIFFLVEFLFFHSGLLVSNLILNRF